MGTCTFYIWYEQHTNPEADDGLGWLVGEIPPAEMAHTCDFLEIDIDPADLDHHIKAQKRQDIYDYLTEHGIAYKIMNEYSMINTGTVVYDLGNQEWGLLEDMETTPTVTHWDGNNMQYCALHDDLWQQEVIVVDNQPVCLDRWDGNNMTTGGRFNHAHVYRTGDDNYLIVESNQWEGSKDKAAVLSADELREYLSRIDRSEEADEILNTKKSSCGIQRKIVAATEQLQTAEQKAQPGNKKTCPERN